MRSHLGAKTARGWTAAVIAVVLAVAIALAGPVPSARAASGRELWVSRFVKYSSDGATDLAVNPDGSMVYVTGYTYRRWFGWAYVTAAYDVTTGARVWLHRYQGPDSSTGQAQAIAVSPDGSLVFVTGKDYRTGTDYDYATLAYDAHSGVEVWISSYNGPGNGPDKPSAIAVSPDGSTVFVTGSSYGAGGTSDYATVAYDSATGARIWVGRYDSPENRDDSATDVAVGANGARVYVTGSSVRSDAGDYQYSATVAYDAATGSRVWTRRYFRGPEESDTNALAVSPDGSKVFVLTSVWRAQTDDYATVAYDASTGFRLWVSDYNGTGDNTDVAADVGVSPDGSTVYVTGETWVSGGGGYDFGTIAYDASTGSRSWVTRHSGSVTPYGTHLAVSPDGSRVYIAGFGRGANSDIDYFALAYDPSGRETWKADYDGDAHAFDEVSALGVSPDGSRVFLTGASEGIGTSWDFATVAYSAG